MCRNIRTLHNFEPPTTQDEVRAAAVQYVRKVSGMQKPSHANEASFEQAVDDIAAATAKLAVLDLDDDLVGFHAKRFRQRAVAAFANVVVDRAPVTGFAHVGQ